MSILNSLIGKEAKDVSPSPFGRWLNGKIVSAERGKITAEIFVRDEFGNPANIMHGGAIAAIIDEVFGITTFSLERDGFFVALNLNIDFLRPGELNSTITAKCEIINEGKSIVHAECKIFNKANELMAKATSNLKLIMTNKN